MRGFIKKHWFLLGLMVVFMAVILDGSNVLADMGTWVKRRHGTDIMVFLIFLISGLVMDIRKLEAGVRDIRATLTALGLIVVISPLMAAVAFFLPLDPGLMVGLFIVAAMPTTLSSGVVMTQTAGGNMAHALFVTIVSNLIAIFSIPFVLPLLLAGLDLEQRIQIEKGDIICKLIVLVLIPLLLGMGLKISVCKSGRLERWRLQMVSQFMILAIVFISLSGAKPVLEKPGMPLLIPVFLVTVFHAILLAWAFLLVRVMRIPRGRFESIVFMGTQKTLPLSVMIQVTYFYEFGTALLVCVLHHILHLIMDGYLSSRMGSTRSD